jgi:Tfp pilus assembly protein PilF
LRTFLIGPLLAVLGLVSVACGGGTSSHKSVSKPVASSKKAGGRSAKTPALREFDAGLRALRLGGPEANERAGESFERAVAADPSMWEAWHDLGVVRSRVGDDRAAITAFTKALAGNPGYRAAILARAESHRRLRHISDARADYEQALKDEPDDLATRLRLASLLREAGDTDGSVKVVREVLRRNAEGKELSDANVELGLIYLAANRQELAELVLSKAATADAKNPRVWNALALLSLKQGKDQEAFQRLDKATELDPTFRDARFNKASVLLDAGDYAQARSELLAALKGQGEGTDLDALVALGVADRGLGKHDDAKADWERVLKVVPMHADALYNLGVLEMDFLRDENRARELLGKYESAAADDHPRQTDAKSRLAELGAAPAPTPPAPAPAPPTPEKKH